MPRTLSSRFSTGGLIVLVGLLLLLSTTGVIELRSAWGWVAALFVLLGVWALIRSEFRNLVGPGMVIAIAGTVFIRSLGVIPDDVIGQWWPLFIVLFGLLIVANRSRRRRRSRLDGRGTSEEVAAVAVFGTDERRIDSDRFTGAELVAIFGDVRIDLRGSVLRTRPAIVETISVFGDVEIRVPDEWNVTVETLNIFGETIDRRPGRTPQSESTDANPQLIVTGLTLFGDVEIRD